MNDIPRQKLIEIIAQYGSALIDEPRRIEGLLNDLCGEYKRENRALLLVVSERAARDLRDAGRGMPSEVLVASLIHRLLDNNPLSEEMARWAVESWAQALGIVKPGIPAQPVEIGAVPPETPQARIQPQAASGVPLVKPRVGGKPLVVPAGDLETSSKNLSSHSQVIQRPALRRRNWIAPAALALLALLTLFITGFPILSSQIDSYMATARAIPLGELKIAVLAPLTGPFSTFGISTRDGVLQAIDEWNARGGVLGKKIVAVVEDSQCSPDPAVNAANKVIDQERVNYIIGEVCSKASIPVSEIANSRHVVQISSISANSAVVRDAAGAVKPYTFVACFNDETQGKAAARFALETLKARNVFLMVDPANTYVTGLSGFFSTAFTLGGGKVVGTANYSGTDTDFSAILTEIATVKPDLVYLPDYYNVASLVTRQAKTKGISVPFLGGDGWDSSLLDFEAADGSYFTNHYSPTENRAAVQNFVKKYGEKYKDDKGNPRLPDALAALAYDSANLMIQAIVNAGEDDPVKVKDSLAAIRLEAVSGTITFDQFHTPVKPAIVVQVKNGRAQFFSQVMP